MDVKKDRGRVKMMRVIVSSCFNPAFRNARGRIQKKIMTVFEKLSPQSTHAVSTTSIEIQLKYSLKVFLVMMVTLFSGFLSSCIILYMMV